MQSHNSALRGGLGDVWDRKAAVCFQNWWSVLCLWPFLTLSGCLYSYTWWLSSSCYTYITPNQDRSLTQTTLVQTRKKKCKHSCHVTRKFAEEVSSNTEPDCCCWSFTRSFLSHRFTYSDNDNYGPYLESVNGVAGNNEARTYWQLLANVTNSEFKPTEVGKLTAKCSITFLVVFNLSYFIDTSIEYF